MSRHYRFRTTPFPHQRAATLRAVALGSMYFAMEPRTGKTKAALDAVGIQALRLGIERVCVVTTLDGIGVWQDELHTHYPFPYATLVVGEPAWRLERQGRTPGPIVRFYLLNYEQYRKRSRPNKRWEYPIAQQIERWAPDILILDESHRVKRAGGVTAQLAWRSVTRMRNGRVDSRPYVYELSGTPNPKGWIDLFAQFRILDEQILGTAVAPFQDRYVEYGKGRAQYTILRYKNLPELKRKYKAHSFIISEAEAFPRAKPQLWSNVPLTLPPTARRVYDEMAEEFIADIRGGEITAANRGARRIRLLQITGGFTTDGRQIHRAKLGVMESILDGLLEAQEAFIVYARFTPEVHALGDLMERRHVPHRVIEGRIRRSDRSIAREHFRRGDIQALVFQVATGSETIDLSTAAETVYYSLPDGWKDYWQSTGRTRGPRQTRAVRYRHIIARSTLDVSVLRTLQVKGDMHAEMMRSPRLFLTGGLARI